MVAAYRHAMDEGRNPIQPVLSNFKREMAVDWRPFKKNPKWNVPADTSVSIERLKFLSQRLVALPENFKLHSRVEKLLPIALRWARVN